MREILSEIAAPGMKVLDAGVGNGKSIKYLKAAGVAEDDITGIDIDPDLLAVAREAYPQVRLLAGDIKKPLKIREKFDLATCIFVLQYFPKKQLDTILTNFYDALVCGGKLLFLVPHPVRMRFENLRNYFVHDLIPSPTPWGTQLPYAHKTVADYINSTIAAGFSIERICEPPVSPAGKRVDLKEYARYAAAPSRFIVVAKKQEEVSK